MASASAIAMAMPITSAGINKSFAGSTAFFHPLRLPSRGTNCAVRSGGRLLEVQASSMKEKAVTGLTAAAVAAALVLPDIAEAAQPGVSPSLKNFLLSIISGGVVLTVIIGAVVGVSNFDPVKRT